jgi:hypothetical protein
MAQQASRPPEEKLTPVEARKGAGSSGMATVLVLSTVLAAVGTALMAYFAA